MNIIPKGALEGPKKTCLHLVIELVLPLKENSYLLQNIVLLVRSLP